MSGAAIWRPALLAVGLALLTTPIVGLSLMLSLAPGDQYSAYPTEHQIVVLAACCSVLAAIAGGLPAALINRSHRTLGPLVAIGIAWPIAVSLVPALAAALGIPYAGVPLCFDECNPMVSSTNVRSGAEAYFQTVVVGVRYVIPAIAALILLWVARLSARTGAVTIPAALVVIAYGAFHCLLFMGGIGVIVPFACLSIGIVLWSWLVGRTPAGRSRT